MWLLWSFMVVYSGWQRDCLDHHSPLNHVDISPFTINIRPLYFLHFYRGICQSGLSAVSVRDD